MYKLPSFSVSVPSTVSGSVLQNANFSGAKVILNSNLQTLIMATTILDLQ